MSIKKEVRKAVYEKYGGRCAYCGNRIAYKDMQVDHFIPQMMESIFIYGEFDGIKSINDIKNLMPSCRMCNHYKRANTIELFRRYIEEIPRKLRDNYIYKVGVKYGLIIENEKPIEFYFESVNREKVKPIEN